MQVKGDVIPVTARTAIRRREAAALEDRHRAVAELRRVPDPHRPRDPARGAQPSMTASTAAPIPPPPPTRAGPSGWPTARRSVQRSRARQIEQAHAIVAAARRLDHRARRPVHDAGAGQGSRRRAADLLPDLRRQGSAAPRGVRGPHRRELRRLRTAAADAARIRSPGCTSTSRSPSATSREDELRHRPALRHRRALATAPALPGGDGARHPALHRHGRSVSSRSRSRRVWRRRPTCPATPGSSPSS